MTIAPPLSALDIIMSVLFFKLFSAILSSFVKLDLGSVFLYELVYSSSVNSFSIASVNVLTVWCINGGSHNLLLSGLNIRSKDNGSCVVLLPKWALSLIFLQKSFTSVVKWFILHVLGVGQKLSPLFNILNSYTEKSLLDKLIT